ncbi:hypothetical protein MWG48_12635 [Escherichia coli]|nr:hypothetical protein [Escherichia coli]
MRKLKMMLGVMSLLPLGRRRLHIKQSVSQCVRLTTASGVDKQPPPNWQDTLNGIISPQRVVDHAAKNNWKEPRVYE